MAASGKATAKRGQAAKTQKEEPRCDSGPQPSGGAIPIWEWIVGGIGFLMVAAVIGFLAHQALEGDPTAPDIRLSVTAVRATTDGYLVNVAVTNHGSSTAQGVILEGVLRSGAEPVEQSQTTIEYLPPRSEKQAGLFFTRDPRQFKFEVRPLGYEEP